MIDGEKRLVIVPSFEEWVDSVFRRPVTDEGWWWDTSQPRPLDPERAPAEALELLNRLFRNPEAVSRFSDQELGQGLWFLFDSSGSSYLDLVRSSILPEQARAGCVESIFELNRELLARRCGDSVEEAGPWSLITTTYMLWDLNDSLGPHPEEPAVDEACLGTLVRILALESGVCQRSALHGLGHWAACYPERVMQTIDGFLTRTGLAPKIRDYAAQARTGHVA